MIPENHLLKKIDVVVDFGFIFDLVEESYCLNFGRPANEPEVLFKLLFIQYLDKLSERENSQRSSQGNLAYKWTVHNSRVFAFKSSSINVAGMVTGNVNVFYFQFCNCHSYFFKNKIHLLKMVKRGIILIY
jgi:hypothetical protein